MRYRNGTCTGPIRLQSVSDTLTPCSTSSEETTRPGSVCPLPLQRVNCPERCRNYSFDGVNADGAELIAKVAADIGVPRFFHISHLNASPHSASKFYQSKAKGEDKVRAALPSATIVRPAAMYGYEDKLLNHLASKLPGDAVRTGE